MHVYARISSVAAIALLGTWGCTSSSTNLTGPSDSKCQISVSNAPASFEASGGAGSLTISAARECTWRVAAEAAWVTLNGGPNGQGEAVVPYVVSPNPAPSVRTTALAVEGNRVPLTQAAAPCQFQLSRSGETLPASGGTARVDVSTLTGCAWSASSTASWVTITTGQSGNASGAVVMTVAVNAGPARETQVSIAGQSYLVQQAGAAAPPPTNPPTPNPDPTPEPPPPTGERVELDGRVLFVTGRCPDIRFFVDFTTVVATAQADYRRGSCDALSIGDSVRVRGTRNADGTVQAERIEFRNDDDDD